LKHTATRYIHKELLIFKNVCSTSEFWIICDCAEQSIDTVEFSG